jgi:hypothetical protein
VLLLLLLSPLHTLGFSSRNAPMRPRAADATSLSRNRLYSARSCRCRVAGFYKVAQGLIVKGMPSLHKNMLNNPEQSNAKVESTHGALRLHIHAEETRAHHMHGKAANMTTHLQKLLRHNKRTPQAEFTSCLESNCHHLWPCPAHTHVHTQRGGWWWLLVVGCWWSPPEAHTHMSRALPGCSCTALRMCAIMNKNNYEQRTPALLAAAVDSIAAAAEAKATAASASVLCRHMLLLLLLCCCRSAPVVHKLVHQLPHHWCQGVGRHELMHTLHQRCQYLRAHRGPHAAMWHVVQAVSACLHAQMVGCVSINVCACLAPPFSFSHPQNPPVCPTSSQVLLPPACPWLTPQPTRA